MLIRQMSPQRVGVFAALSLCVTAGAHASTYQYTYTGPNFTVTNPGTCLTATKHIKISFKLPRKLPPNSVTGSLTPLSWVANTGAHAFKSSSAGTRSASFSFTTDVSGKIISWNVVVQLLTPANKLLESDAIHVDGTSGYDVDQGVDGICHPASYASTDFGIIGRWSHP